MEPMLNVIGITGGYTGPSFMTTLPMNVSAKVDVRFTPNLSQADIVPLLRKPGDFDWSWGRQFHVHHP